MRLVLICALFATVAAAAAIRTEALTIVLEFQGSHSARSIDEMKRELEGILKDAPLAIDWRMRADIAQVPPGNLVVFRFRGKCVLEPVGYLYDERGPMAFTYSTDGAVQPFSEVACDKVAGTVRSAMSPADFARADLLLGRALGRVLAHELVHMLSKSGKHGERGVARPALTPAQLISPDLHLAPADLERIYTEP